MGHACQPSQALQTCSSFGVSCAWLPCSVAGLHQFYKGLCFTKVTLVGQTRSLLHGKQEGRGTKKRNKTRRKSSQQQWYVLYYRSHMGLKQSQRKKRKVTLSPVSGLVSLKKSKIQMTKAHWGGCLRTWYGFHFKVMLTPEVVLPCPPASSSHHTPRSPSLHKHLLSPVDRFLMHWFLAHWFWVPHHSYLEDLNGLTGEKGLVGNLFACDNHSFGL